MPTYSLSPFLLVVFALCSVCGVVRALLLLDLGHLALGAAAAVGPVAPAVDALLPRLLPQRLLLLLERLHELLLRLRLLRRLLHLLVLLLQLLLALLELGEHARDHDLDRHLELVR